jgi:glucose-6-phosphate isomerase
MLNFDYTNLIQIYNKDPKNSVCQAEIHLFSKNFKTYKKSIQSKNLGFLDLPKNQFELQKIVDFAKENRSKYEDIVILGIGGSMLGPQVLLDVFDQKILDSGLKIHCLDNIDPDLIFHVTQKINLTKTLFLVQTKSGTTPETLAQFFYFLDLCKKQNLEIQSHFVFVTDPVVGYLRKFAIENKIISFEIPANVGGRFSVLSPVGLVIGILINLDINNLMDGAQNILQSYFYEENPEVLNFSTIQYILAQKNKNINVLMPYSSRLKTLSSWFVQLLSESIGKQKKDQSSVGITPLPSLGATDQHSQLQLFKEGPNDKLIIFIEVQKQERKLPIPEILEPEFDYLSQKSFNELLKAEFLGTRQSLTESLKPNLTLTIDKVDEFNLGQLFMFFQLSIAFLGEMFEINAFDQPGVERSKVLTKEFLAR